MKKLILLLVVVYSIVPTLQSHPHLITSYTIVKKNKIVVKIGEKFARKFLIKEDFFAEYDKNIDLHSLNESVVLIPFILNIIPVVWLSQESYSIDAMDKDLYYSLKKIKKVFRLFYPRHAWSGELIPKKLVTNTIKSKKKKDKPSLALLFSGGLDSVNSSINYLDSRQLLITAWGADVKLSEKDKWINVHEQCNKFAKTYGHEHAFVKSNFRECIETSYLCNKFPSWWVRISHALSFVGLAAPLLAIFNIPVLFISSTYTVEHSYPYASHPAIDNNIVFAETRVCHVDADKNRVEKIINIADIVKKKDISLPSLRVCWSSAQGDNCLACEKCFRTITELIIAEKVPREYGFCIDVDEVIQKIKEFFKEGKELKPTEMFFWHINRDYLQLLIKNKENKKFAKHKYLPMLQSLLNSINLKRARGFYLYRCSPKKKKLCRNLWLKNLKESTQYKEM